MRAWYNEIDPFAAEWLANLVSVGAITRGVIEKRSVAQLLPVDVTPFRRCHFFAGIGLWDYALQLAGWPDDLPVWTGSCPCQPFSNAGARKGFDDERHLWPVWFWLIDVCRPPIVVGEQVSSPAGRAWLDLVFSDLEGAGYSCGAADLCAAGVGAPHRRQRLYWAAVRGGAVAHPRGAGLEERPGLRGDHGAQLPAAQRGGGAIRPLADPQDLRRQQHEHGRAVDGAQSSTPEGEQGSALRPVGGVSTVAAANPHEGGLVVVREARLHGDGALRDDPARRGEARAAADAETTGTRVGDDRSSRDRGNQEALGERLGHGVVLDNPWGDVEWLPCRDGVYRPTQPGLLPLAHGNTCRVGKLRAYGNAIVAPLAATFLRSLMDVLVIE